MIDFLSRVGEEYSRGGEEEKRGRWRFFMLFGFTLGDFHAEIEMFIYPYWLNFFGFKGVNLNYTLKDCTLMVDLFLGNDN